MASEFLKGIKDVKVKDLPDHVKPLMSREFVSNKWHGFIRDYHRKYILTSSIKPLWHVIFGVMALSYVINLPTERRHLRHQKEHEEGHH